jgi:hypothetical protein
MGVVFWAIVIVLGAVLLSLAGEALVQRVVPLKIREADNAVTGVIYEALLVFFGLMVGFALFIVWTEYREAESTVAREADTVADLYQLAEYFPESERDRIQDLTRSYAKVVVAEEWPLLGQGRASRQSPHAKALAEQLVSTVQGFEPTTNAEQARYSEALVLVQTLDDERAERVVESHQGVPHLVWVVLILGWVLTMSFTFFFGMESSGLHKLYTTALAVLAALTLYVIFRMEFPFTGPAQVTPAAFESALHEMVGQGK